MAEAREPAPPDPDAQAERLVEQAVRSVLDAVPTVSGDDTAPVDTSPTLQPWAETAAPAGRDKRPLEALLQEYAERVARAPDAQAGRPAEQHPAQAYLDSLQPAVGAARKGKRRWHGRRRGRGRGRRGAPASS